MKSNGLGLSALRNGPRLEVSPAVGGNLDSEPRGVGGEGSWLSCRHPSLLTPTAALGPQPLYTPSLTSPTMGTPGDTNSQIKEETKIQGGAEDKSGLVTGLQSR